MKTPMMPREHMQSAPSVDALSDVELLAVVLGKGVRGYCKINKTYFTKPDYVVRRLLDRWGIEPSRVAVRG